MTQPVNRQKPEKPYADFPLTANNNGQWCKKIRGKVHSFGVWANWQGALAKYNAQKDYLHAGQRPPTGELTMADLGNLFFTAKALDVRSGAVSQRSFDEYKAAYELAVNKFGKTQAVATLTPDQFRELRTTFAEKWGPTTAWNATRRIRMVFNWGFREGHMQNQARYGTGFSRSKRETRLVETESGERMFEAAELRLLIETAKPQLKAWILLGINCAYGQNDIATLPVSRIAGEWITHPRPKTGTPRRCHLWPETLEALGSIRRYSAKDNAHEKLLFISKYGDPLVRYQRGFWLDGIGQVFNKHAKDQGVKRKGIGFYSLRRTFRTIADEVKDSSATALVMGHLEFGMGALYTQRISDDRLKAVTDYVRNWLNIVSTKVEPRSIS